jgi:uncharacterized membrane protein (DUF373 family)
MDPNINPNEILKRYEKVVYLVLIVLFALIVTFSIGELIYIVFVALFVNSPLLLEQGELLGIFGYFLLVLIGVELLAVTSAYVNEKVIHVEVVMIIAIIAVARGIILLDTGNANPLSMFGTAAILLALCAGYYLLKTGGARNQ